MDREEEYADFSNVVKQHNFLTAEEFPEGPYESAIKAGEPVENKSTPWEKGQQYNSNFTYEARNFHQDLPRQYPGAHPTHDDKDVEKDPKY